MRVFLADPSIGRFFELSKTDAERAMGIYRAFTRQTDYVVQYLSVARQYEHHTRVEGPKLKHAPVNLGRQLDEYLKDPDFEINRRQYLAELEAKKSKGSSGATKTARFQDFPTPSSSTMNTTTNTARNTNGPQPSQLPTPPKSEPVKAPDTDLIDFFESIEQNQTPLPAQPPPQQGPQPTPQEQMQVGMSPWGPAPFQPQQLPQPQTGFAPQPTGFQTSDPFQQQSQPAFSPIQQSPQHMLPAFTSTGFGGFSPQPQPGFQPNSSLSPIPQNSVANFQNTTTPGFQGLQAPQQTTNPFRQSMLMNQQTGSPFTPAPAPANTQQRPATSQSTNPFARSSPQADQPFGVPNPPFDSTSPFQSQPPQQQPAAAPAPMLPMQTGTNPFAKNGGSAQPAQPTQQQQRPVTAGGILSQPTGTNPFRQGAFVNHNTGMGWQHNQQTMGGGLDQLEPIPVFPRPAQQTPWQQ
jgi:hypothetical protein